MSSGEQGLAGLLTVNAGSTSVRLAMFALDRAGSERRELLRQRLPAGPGTEADVLESFLREAGMAPVVVIHRVVHAGFVRDTRPFDDSVHAAVVEFSGQAPLHNPHTLSWADACSRRLPDATALAAFDTGFFRDLPETAATYGLPRELSRRLGLRRLGFHGLAHRSMWQRLRQEAPAASGRVVSLQLGGGSSAAALRDGKPVDTSMGFSPLEGLVMATRPGDLDPGALLRLIDSEGLGPEQLRDLLYRQSGLLGISGISGDMRSLLASSAPEAALAVEVFCHRVRRYVGAFLAVLGGADAVVIGGGAGEGSPELRRRMFSGLEGLGIRIDPRSNAAARAPALISPGDGPVQVWVIPTDEEAILADEACAWLAADASSRAPDLQK